MFVSRNPATATLLAERPCWETTQLEATLASAHLAQRQWALRPLSERVIILRQLASALADEQEGPRLIHAEMGKLLTEAEAEVHKAARLAEYYADHAAEFLAPQSHGQGEVQFAPLGLVLAVMPWNFPFWQVLRAAIPALLCGNALLWKPAPNVALASQRLADLAVAAGLPPGLLQPLWIAPQQVESVLAHPAVAMVTFTGSSRTGRIIGELAGRQLKKSLLELGGSDPFIVLADADLDAAAAAALHSRFGNAGQTCIAAKRFIVEDCVAEAFVQRFVQRIATLQAGVNLAPLARADLCTTLAQQVEDAMAHGARCLYRGETPQSAGFWFPPMLLDNVDPASKVAQEEVFGPVAVVLRVTDSDAAIALANASAYGLSGSIWSRDVDRADALASQLESGSVYLNRLPRSDLALPFGGVKQSGYGRELGRFGLWEFCNIRAVHR